MASSRCSTGRWPRRRGDRRNSQDRGAGMSDDSRDKILDTFLGLVAEHGYGEVSLADVGTAAGLGKAELYRLYPDKLALVAGFMARIDGEVLTATPAADDP